MYVASRTCSGAPSPLRLDRTVGSPLEAAPGGRECFLAMALGPGHRLQPPVSPREPGGDGEQGGCKEERVWNLGFLGWGPSLGPQGLSSGCEVRPTCLWRHQRLKEAPEGCRLVPQGEGGRKTALLVGGPMSQLEPGATQGNRRANHVPPAPAQRGLFSGHCGPCPGLEGGCSKQSVRLTGDQGSSGLL